MFDYGESATWSRWVPGGTDEYGNSTPGHYEDQQLDGVGFAPESTEEASLDQRVVSQAKLYLTESIPYTAKDRFVVRGVTFGVDGTGMGGWVNPFTGTDFGQEIQLRRVTG